MMIQLRSAGGRLSNHLTGRKYVKQPAALSISSLAMPTMQFVLQPGIPVSRHKPGRHDRAVSRISGTLGDDNPGRAVGVDHLPFKAARRRSHAP
jgi:hypothetical protein